MALQTRRDNLATILKDIGVAVTLGTSRTYGKVRLAGAEELAEFGFTAISDRTIMVSILSGTLPGLAADTQVTLNGGRFANESFVVKRQFPADDGELTHFFCVKQ